MHPFYIQERGWVNAGELKVGEHVRKADGGYGRVQKVEREQRKQTMYNLTVEKAHTFFVGTKRWLVHNTCNPLPPESGVPQHVTEAIAGTLKENEALGITDMDVGTHFSLLEKGFDIPFKPVGADTLAKLEGSGLRLVKTQGGLTATQRLGCSFYGEKWHLGSGQIICGYYVARAKRGNWDGPVPAWP